MSPRQITAADTPAKSVVQRADWADYGKDYYAAVPWEDTPDGKRYMIGWMNNWDYSGVVLTSPWRGAQSIPSSAAPARPRSPTRSSPTPPARECRCSPRTAR